MPGTGRIGEDGSDTTEGAPQHGRVSYRQPRAGNYPGLLNFDVREIFTRDIQQVSIEDDEIREHSLGQLALDVLSPGSMCRARGVQRERLGGADPLVHHLLIARQHGYQAATSQD